MFSSGHLDYNYRPQPERSCRESAKVNAKPDPSDAGAMIFPKTRGLRATMSWVFFNVTQRNGQALELFLASVSRRASPCFTFA
jgi:hypothetical protein